LTDSKKLIYKYAYINLFKIRVTSASKLNKIINLETEAASSSVTSVRTY
jgi:hypothetical protein